MTGKEGIGAGTAARPLDDLLDLDDPTVRQLSDSAHNETPQPKTYLDGIVDTMLKQQADVDTASVGEQSQPIGNLTRQEEGRKSVVATMLAHIATMSGGNDRGQDAVNSTNVTNFIGKSAGAGDSSPQTWKQHLGNPLCFSLAGLCLLLMVCVLWLARTRPKRRRVLA